ncbi:MAG: hypothetical protein ABIP80_03310 [Ferruginibacter sp.]
MKKQLRFRIFYLQAVLLIAGVIYLNDASSQGYSNLEQLKDSETQVYYSTGHEQRAKDIATRTQKAIDYNAQLLGFKPKVTLLILTPEDWSKHTTFPVYGMAHYKDDQTLVVATSDNDFWRSFIPPVEQLPTSLAEKIKKAYKTSDGKLSMQPFFDLLALHELGHAFHKQGNLTMQRKWMGELFCNIFLHTYIAQNEKSLLPALEIFPEMVVAAGTAGYKFTTLDEFEKNYTELTKEHPKNYGWYECRLHVAAKDIYGKGGKKVLVKLWNALRSTPDKMDDRQFAAFLKKKVHKSLSDVMLKW